MREKKSQETQNGQAPSCVHAGSAVSDGWHIASFPQSITHMQNSDEFVYYKI